MKVYAEYFIEGEKSFRKKTLIHFGNSTDLIGSAVLINPGSAKPIGGADKNFISTFYYQNHSIKTLRLEHWKSFAADPTIRQLQKIFDGDYIGEKKELNGVIQLFNCFYYKEPDLDNAIANKGENPAYHFNENDLFLDKPVYFGWGNQGKYGEISDIANNIFSQYNGKSKSIYHPDFLSNCFYHPGYVNRSHKRNKNTIKLLKDFGKLFQ